MHGQSSVESSIVEGLIITDLNNDNPVEVARCYTRHEIPVSQEQIPTPKVVSKFDNLRTISKKIPELIPDVDVGVLIGSNCPLALEPLEVLPSGGKGPFAMRLRHGWTVSGPLHIQPQATSQGCNATSHRITVQELESIKEVITQSVMTMFELDFNDHSSTSDDSSLSQEDKEFLSIADQGTRRVDGHYELPLPSRDPNVVMPNNRVQAEKRAGWQRKKMLRNDEYHRDYTNFINSRPLTFISNDIDDLEPLTPSHLLTTKSAVIVPPPGNFQKGDVYMKRRWRRVQYLTNLFWTRWKKEYLVTLQQRHKWQNPGRNLTVGDVVIIKDENASRNSWSMGDKLNQTHKA
ncbi:hypothetical protein QZH41_002291 [Actinostola sp. cb2023]|nr:hypothetical protein QZH41_002291 [Actinostola sp. cb2023]